MSYQLCRRKIAPELESCAFSDRRTIRKAAYDPEGRDVRSVTFGVRWQMIRDKREETLQEFTRRIQTVFDELYEKMTGGQRTSIDCHLLPTIKTPAIRKTRARLKSEVDGPDKDVALITTTLTFQDEGDNSVPVIQDITNTVTQTAVDSPVLKKDDTLPQVTGGPENSSFDNEEVVATASRRGTRSRLAKKVVTVSSDSSNVPPTTTSRGRTRGRTTRKTRQTQATVSVEDTDTGVDCSPPPQVVCCEGTVRRSTRTRRARKDTEDENVVATASRRTTRARTRQQQRGQSQDAAVGGKESAQVDQDTSDSPNVRRSTRSTSRKALERESFLSSCKQTAANSSPVGTSSVEASVLALQSPLVVQSEPENDRLSGRKLSHVTVERSSLSSYQVPSPVDEDGSTQGVVEETVLRPDEGVGDGDGEVGACKEKDITLSSSECLQETQHRSTLASKRPLQSPPSTCQESTDSDDDPYMKPPPPKKPLKLNKKAGRATKGKRGKKQTAPTSTDVIDVDQSEDDVIMAEVVDCPGGEVTELREEANVSLGEQNDEDVVVTASRSESPSKDGEGSTSSEDIMETDDCTREPSVPPAVESMYESCVSDMERTPVQTRHLSCVQSPTATLPDTSKETTDPPATVTKPETSTTCLAQTSSPLTQGSPPIRGSSTITKSSFHKTPVTCTKAHSVLSPVRMSNLNRTPRQLSSSPAAGGKVISIAQLRTNHSRPPTPRTITKPHPLHQTHTSAQTPLSRAKRLHSVSLEKLPGDVSRKLVKSSYVEEKNRDTTPTMTSGSEADETPEKGGSSSAEKTSDPDSDDCHNDKGVAADKPKNSYKHTAFWQLMQKKGEGIASKLTLANLNSNLPSFLPKNSPKKHETFEAKLVEKMQRKKEDEEQRQREMEQKKQQELAEKIRKREERLKRVAEKQAAMQREEAEKKKKAHGLKYHDDELKKQKIIEKRHKEVEERNRKYKEHKEAVENRRKQEEEQRLKRLQQIEEERRMAEELLRQRQEQEEEEKRIRRLERLRQEQEKQAEAERQELEMQKKREKELEKQQNPRHPQSHEATADSQQEEKKRFEKLLASQQKGTSNYRLVQQWKQHKSSPTQTSGGTALEVKNKGAHTKSKPELSHLTSIPESDNTPTHVPATSPATVIKSKPTVDLSKVALNSTFTMDGDDAKTPTKPPNSKYTTAASYEMTPAEVQDPMLAYSNYDISELSDDDSTDDEEHPKKPVPLWAHPHVLQQWMAQQEKQVTSDQLDVAQIFPPEQLLQMPDLAKIFRVKRRRFYQRSSSAHWDSPMLKKTKSSHNY